MRDQHQKEFCKFVLSLSHSRGVHIVFRDFCEMAAISMSNAVDYLPHWKEREENYKRTAKGYSKDEIKEFPKMLGALVMSLEEGFHDCLGEIFQELELSNHWNGQFFTPYPIAQAMAKMTMGGDKIPEKGFWTAADPAVGAGSLVIALAETMKQMDINYQQCLHVTAEDIDITACHMAYLQLSLLHVPAVVIHGDTLLPSKTWSHWYTPAHILGGWSPRLKRYRESQPPEKKELPKGQISLF